MNVQLPPDLEAKLDQLVSETGRPWDEFVRDAMAGYFGELGQVRQTLDGRYDDVKSGRVKLISSEEVATRSREMSKARRLNS